LLYNRIPVDDICIGDYECARTRLVNPCVQCFENVVTLYVWDNKRIDEDEKKRFEVDIPYSSITYVTFSKSNDLSYIVFETSRDPLERRSKKTRSKTGGFKGKFIHNSHHMRKKSIMIASTPGRILLIRKQFNTFFPEGKGLKAKRPHVKSKEYVDCHGLKVRPVDEEKVILEYPELSGNAVTLTSIDVWGLQPGVFLSTKILYFYLQYLYFEK